MWKKISRFILVLVSLALGGLICFTVFGDINFLSNNSEIVWNINKFFENIGLKYRFTVIDVSRFVRFTEYCVFGIMITSIAKMYSKNIFKNICFPLFIGLAVSVLEVYLKNFGGSNLEVSDILISFVEFCMGLIFYIIFGNLKFSKKRKTRSRYKSRKYEGRY